MSKKKKEDIFQIIHCLWLVRMNGCPPLNFINLQAVNTEVDLPEDQLVGTIIDNLPINLLPDEVWVHIFGFLEFRTLQFKATCVCKKWFKIIRNDSNLSGEFSLLTEDWFDINALLLSWKKVKVVRSPVLVRDSGINDDVLQLIDIPDVDLRKVNFKVCKLLKKVVVTNFRGKKAVVTEFPPWINVSKYWYDPHIESSEIGPENVVKLGIRIAEETYNEVDSTLEDMGRRMNDLEEMFIMYSTNYRGNFDFCLPLVKGLQTCPNLCHLDFCFTGDGSDYNQDLR